MTASVNVASVVLETVQPAASVDVATVFAQTAAVVGGVATVDVAEVTFTTDPPASAAARVDVANVYLRMLGDTSFVNRWICDSTPALVPVLGVHFASKNGLVD